MHRRFFSRTNLLSATFLTGMAATALSAGLAPAFAQAGPAGCSAGAAAASNSTVTCSADSTLPVGNGSQTGVTVAVESGVTLQTAGAAIQLNDGTVTNSGTIRNTAVLADGAVVSYGIQDTLSLTNAAGAVIEGGSAGAVVSHGGLNLVNLGTVSSTGTVAVTNSGIGVLSLDNAGTITGAGPAVVSGEGADSVINRAGAVLGRADAATAATAVDLGGGDDLFEQHTGASVTGVVDGGSGRNTLRLHTTADQTVTAAALGQGYVNFAVLEKTGSATLTLAGVPAMATLQVEAGTLQGDAASLGGSDSAVAIVNNAVVVVDESGVAPATLAATVSGTGQLVKSGSGTVALSGANSHLGGTVVEAGVLSVGEDANLGDVAGTLTLDGGSLLVTASFETARTVTLVQQWNTIDTGANVLTLSGDVEGPGGLLKQGSGDLLLTGNYTYGGGTRVIAGRVLFLGANLLPADTDVELDAGEFNLNNNDQTVGTLRGDSGLIDLTQAVLTVNQGREETFAGRIISSDGLGGTNSSGTFVKSGDGTLVLALQQQATYTGATVVESGTLKAGGDNVLSRDSTHDVTGGTLDLNGTRQSIGGLSGGGTVNAGTGATLQVGNNGASTTFSGDITGSGTLVKTGSGTLTLAGDTSLTGTAAVDDGTLAVDGTLNTAVFVRGGGTLGGSGVINSQVTVQSGGTLAAGRSPGILTVTDDVVMAAGATLEVDVDGATAGTGAGHHDQIRVVGADKGFVAAGTLAPRLRGISGSADNSFVPVLGQGFTVVRAEGGVGGSFGQLAQPTAGLPAGTRFDAVYGDTTLTLHLTPARYADLAAIGIAPTGNRRAVAQALDAARPDAGVRPEAAVKPLYDVLYPQDAAGITQVLDQYSPKIYGDATLGALAHQRLIGQAVAARLAQAGTAGAAGRSTAALAGLSFALNGGAAAAAGGGAAAGSGTSEPAGDGTAGGLLTPWVRVLGHRAQVGSDGGTAGFDRTSAGMLAGADARLSESVRVGGAAGFVTGRIDGGSGGRADVDTYAATLYGRYTAGAWAFDASVGYSYHEYLTRRQIGSAVQSGEATGRGVSAALGTSYQVRLSDTLSVVPGAGVRYDATRRDGTTERGVVPTPVAGDEARGLTSALGARVVWQGVQVGNAVIEPELRARWEHDFGDRQLHTAAALGGVGFTADSARSGRDAAVLGGGVAVALDGNLKLFADYQAEIRTRETGHTFSGGLRLTW